MATWAEWEGTINRQLMFRDSAAAALFPDLKSRPSLHHALICTSVARRVVLSHEMLREQVRHSDLADNLPVDDDRDGLTGTVIDVVAVLTRRLGTGVHLDLARA